MRASPPPSPRTRRRRPEAANAEPAEEPIARTLAIDEVKIELGYGLLMLINDVAGRKLTDQIKALRRTLRPSTASSPPRCASSTTCACPTRATESWSRRWRRGPARCGSARSWPWTRAAARWSCLASTAASRLRPARHLDRRGPARGGQLPRLHGRGPRHRAYDAPDRDPQGLDVRPPRLRRGAEAAEGSAARAEEAGRRPDPLGGPRHHRAPGASRPAQGARVDPRPADHSGRHRARRRRTARA